MSTRVCRGCRRYVNIRTGTVTRDDFQCRRCLQKGEDVILRDLTPAEREVADRAAHALRAVQDWQARHKGKPAHAKPPKPTTAAELVDREIRGRANWRRRAIVVCRGQELAQARGWTTEAAYHSGETTK